MPRCINIDWLELYCLENAQRYPCDADYYAQQGYFVKIRDYGTRVYDEMFTIYDREGNPWIEVRRKPAAGNSSFSGLVPESCHLRLVNRQCYITECVSRLRDFLLLHGYIFKRIYRIDVCYDFEVFDSGDKPATFARRYLERRYSKINQCKLAAFASEGWASFAWESLSWGSRTSMVSTKMYNKSKELSERGHDKPYIRRAWLDCNLIDDPVNMTMHDNKGRIYKPDIWRVEFSLKSTADRWLVIEDVSGKKRKKKAIPHTLELFDAPDKLWQRFQDLAFHYFRFKHVEWKESRAGLTAIALSKVKVDVEKSPIRKDRCRDKVLFRFEKNREFLQVTQVPTESQPIDIYKRLLELLKNFRDSHADLDIRKACDILITYLNREGVRRILRKNDPIELNAIQRALAAKMAGSQRSIVELAAEIQEMLENNEIF